MPKTNLVLKAILLFLVCYLGAGCGPVTIKPVVLSPDKVNKSPLSTITPLKIDLKVNDNRPAKERADESALMNGKTIMMTQFKMTQDTPTMVRKALVAQLTTDGHTVTPEGAPDAQVLIQVDLNRFSSDFKSNFFGSKASAILWTQVTITNPQVKETPISETVNATAEQAGYPDQRLLEDSLVKYLRDFSRDPKIIEAFKAVQP